jgi:PAS domain S-box-containing protein
MDDSEAIERSDPRASSAFRAEFEAALADQLSVLLAAAPEELDAAVIAAQRAMCTLLSMDRSAIWQGSPEAPEVLRLTHLCTLDTIPPFPEGVTTNASFPWFTRQLLDGRTVVVPDVAALPAEADVDRRSLQYYLDQSTLAIPFAKSPGAIRGAISFAATTRRESWPDHLVVQCGLVVRVIQSVLTRKHADEALATSRAQLAEAQRLAGIGSWELDLRTNALAWSEETFRIFEVAPASFGGSYEAFLAIVHPDDRSLVDDAHRSSVAHRTPYDLAHRLRMADGRIKWVQVRGQTFYDGKGAQRSIGTVQDITDRRRHEERLAEAQALAHVGSYEVDLGTDVVWWSDELYRIFGYAPSACVPSRQAYLAAIAIEDRARITDAARQSRATREPTDLEYRVSTPAGVLRHVREQRRFIRDDDGVFRRMEGTIQDVTLIEHGKLRLQHILDGVFAFVGLCDLDGTLIDSNCAFRDATPAHEIVLGRPLWETYGFAHSPEIQHRTRQLFVRAARGERVREDLKVRVSGDRLITLDAVFAPLRDAHGHIDGVVGSGVDVSDRLAAEAVLHDREARLAAIFDHTADAIVLAALGPDDVLRIAAVNRAFLRRVARAVEVKESELVGLDVDGLPRGPYALAFQDFDAFIARYRTVIATRSPIAFEHSRELGGSLLHADVVLAPVLDATGRCTHVLCTSRDVTARKAAASALEASLAEKETLLREIHHRVKNNLQVIASLVHFQAKKSRTDEDAAAFAELRQRIYSMSLVHERLYQSPDVSRIHFGDYVRSLVSELARSYEPPPGVRVEVTSDDVCLPIELALPSGMIVNELLTNTLKYAYPHGRAGTARVSVHAIGPRVSLRVDDDGVGFPDGFDPSSSRSFGWQLVRALVTQLGGTIETESRETGG